MNFKGFNDKFVNLINNNRQNLVRLSLSAFALIFLVIVFYFSSDSFRVNSETEILISYIEDRKYGMAESYYEDLQKQFSNAKMTRFNKKASKKISSILMSASDKFVNGEITREKYMGLINMVNSLNTLEIDPTGIIDTAKRVDEMYLEENISYDSASAYFQISSTLRGINQGLDEYKQHVKEVYESREKYNNGTKYQAVKKYHEAIEQYDKVIKEDEKYYSLSQNAKKECIKVMYDYYMEQGKSLGDEGKYEEGLKYINYLNPYYEDDEKLNELEEEYNKKISNYTMTSDDILSIVARRSGESKKDLKVVSYLQTIDGERYYYGEVIKSNEVINEVLIDAKSKKLYAYKSDKKDYDCNYSDAYFKISEKTGEIIFSISENEAKEKLENQFKNNEKKYKNINILSDKEIQKYSNEELKKLIDKNGNIYYYFVVKQGWFKPKEVYAVNMYNKSIYCIENDGIEKYV